LWLLVFFVAGFGLASPAVEVVGCSALIAAFARASFRHDWVLVASEMGAKWQKESQAPPLP